MLQIPLFTTPIIIISSFFFQLSGIIILYFAMIIGSIFVYYISKKNSYFMMSLINKNKYSKNILQHVNLNQSLYLILLNLFVPHVVLNISSGIFNFKLKNVIVGLFFGNIFYYFTFYQIGRVFDINKLIDENFKLIDSIETDTLKYASITFAFFLILIIVVRNIYLKKINE